MPLSVAQVAGAALVSEGNGDGGGLLGAAGRARRPRWTLVSVTTIHASPVGLLGTRKVALGWCSPRSSPPQHSLNTNSEAMPPQDLCPGLCMSSVAFAPTRYALSLAAGVWPTLIAGILEGSGSGFLYSLVCAGLCTVLGWADDGRRNVGDVVCHRALLGRA